MKKGKIIATVLLIIALLLLITRFCVLDVIRVPEESKCTRAGRMAIVNRWAYGYRLPWRATSRISSSTAKTNDWVTYNKPVASRGEEADTTELRIGRIAAAPKDTLWYNNESGRISVNRNPQKGYTHPLIVPSCGKTLQITNENVRFYAITIMLHEPVKASIVDNMLCVSGKVVTEYTFQQDYYWMTSDNVKNMSDSRSFGFVPQASLIGKIL